MFHAEDTSKGGWGLDCGGVNPQNAMECLNEYLLAFCEAGSLLGCLSPPLTPARWRRLLIEGGVVDPTWLIV